MIVRYTFRAQQHLRKIGDFIAERDPVAAERILSRIAESIERLETFPYSARRGLRRGSYELVVPDLPYIVGYRVGRGYVDILGVFHAGRHPSIRSRP